MKHSVIAEVKIIPLGTGRGGVSQYIADCVSVLNSAPDLEYRVTPMATVIRGDLDRILEMVRQMHEVPFGKGVERVVTSISIDDRRDKELTMDGKVKAVEEKLVK